MRSKQEAESISRELAERERRAPFAVGAEQRIHEILSGPAAYCLTAREHGKLEGYLLGLGYIGRPGTGDLTAESAAELSRQFDEFEARPRQGKK